MKYDQDVNFTVNKDHTLGKMICYLKYECTLKFTLNIRTRSDSKVMESKAGSPSSFERVSSHTTMWSTSFVFRSVLNAFSSFFIRRFSSFIFSLSRASACTDLEELATRTWQIILTYYHIFRIVPAPIFTFSIRALYVNLTLPPSRVCDRLSSLTMVANSSKVVLTCQSSDWLVHALNKRNAKNIRSILVHIMNNSIQTDSCRTFAFIAVENSCNVLSEYSSSKVSIH